MSWLNGEIYVKLNKDTLVPYNMDDTLLKSHQLMENLKIGKYNSTQWAKQKKLKDVDDLKTIEVGMKNKEKLEAGGYESEEAK